MPLKRVGVFEDGPYKTEVAFLHFFSPGLHSNTSHFVELFAAKSPDDRKHNISFCQGIGLALERWLNASL